jgi:hypothetical protein
MDTRDHFIAHYRDCILQIKYQAVNGRISGSMYHEVAALMRLDAVKDGLTDRDFDSIVNDVEFLFNHAQERVRVASFDKVACSPLRLTDECVKFSGMTSWKFPE